MYLTHNICNISKDDIYNKFNITVMAYMYYSEAARKISESSEHKISFVKYIRSSDSDLKQTNKLRSI